jgi:AmmeMemoRadiSam system protein B
VAVWLHYLLGEKRCALVPVLCGSFHRFITENNDISSDETISRAISALANATAMRRTLVVAAADLAHVGPAFGDPLQVDALEQVRQRAADSQLMNDICAGDVQGFFQRVKAEGDRRHICGLAPVYWAMRLLGSAKGVVTGYEQSPADSAGSSIVSICGIVLL